MSRRSGRARWEPIVHTFNQSGKSAAVALSLIQTCRSLQINPRDYLEDVMRRLLDHPANRLNELLPDKWAKSQNK